MPGSGGQAEEHQGRPCWPPYSKDDRIIPLGHLRRYGNRFCARPCRCDQTALTTRGDATEALRASAGKHGHRFMNLYGHDELGTIATLGGHELRARLMPAQDLDRATVEVRIEGVRRATTQIARQESAFP